MSKFDIFTKYIPIIQVGGIGEWVVLVVRMGMENG